MDANPQDCEIFSVNPQDMDVYTINLKRNQLLSDLMYYYLFEDVSTLFVIASHTEKPMDVTPEILAKL